MSDAERNAADKARIIEVAEKDFVTDVDGYLYFWAPQGGGGWASYALRIIADELDRRNKPWDDIVQNDPAIGKPIAPGTFDV
jgi:hypothetical protein